MSLLLAAFHAEMASKLAQLPGLNDADPSAGRLKASLKKSEPKPDFTVHQRRLKAGPKFPPHPPSQARGMSGYGRLLAGLPSRESFADQVRAGGMAGRRAVRGQGQVAKPDMGVLKMAALSDAEKKRRRHEYYVRNRHKILQRQMAYRNKNQAAIKIRGKKYRRDLKHGARKQRKRLSGGAHQYQYGGYKLGNALAAATAPRPTVKGLKMPRPGGLGLTLGAGNLPGSKTPARPFSVNWKKPSLGA